MDKPFEQEWRAKVSAVRASRFWRDVVSSPPRARVLPPPGNAGQDAVRLDARWSVALEGPASADGPARTGLRDLVQLARANFSVALDGKKPADAPRLAFELAPSARAHAPARWDRSFRLSVAADEARVRAGSEEALLRASLYLTNYWRLRRSPVLAPGRRSIRPTVPVHIGADLWGGFNTTQAWIDGRENDTNFLELARMGVNFVPVMARFEEFCHAAPKPFQSLVNPQAEANRRRLAKLARQMARYDVHLLLMANNPHLAADHPVFRAAPSSRGALQHRRSYRALCSSDPPTRRFLADAWSSLFAEIPELGGMLMLAGGEGFSHCRTRSRGADQDCPRCSRRDPSAMVAELVNAVARAVHRESPDALTVVWPYSAIKAWSQHDRDQEKFIAALDPAHVMFQTETDKDTVDWRPAGYAKHIWDYSISYVSVTSRCRRQRRLCAARRLPFSCKIEVNNSIECVNVPWLPVLENQRRIWENCRRLRPDGVQSRWMSFGSCKSPAEELGYWAIWGRGTEFGDLDAALDAIARRDFGDRAAPLVRRAWHLFSEAIRHHPMLDYYKGSFFIGPCQPLALDPAAVRDLDPAFFGRFYWDQQEGTPSQRMYETAAPLFYYQPAWTAIARRGPKAGQDVALDELRALAALWQRGAAVLASARPLIPPACRTRYEREWTLAEYLAQTWRSAANVEEFLRLRDTIRKFSADGILREGHRRENLRDVRRIRRIAEDELRIAREALHLASRPDADFLNTALRLDMGAASTTEMLQAKIRQVAHLLKVELPDWEDALQNCWK